eukprot:CCRYP_007148-RA/>CCRYP_007148-RA protein AED:0.41 eAED:0.50 QI:0/0/0/1/0/0/4/0/132
MLRGGSKGMGLFALRLRIVLLCHDVDGSIDGTIDIKNRSILGRIEAFPKPSDCLSKDACWGDEDEQFELGLLKWGADVEQLKKPCWIEDWDNVMDNGAVMRTRLLNKYGGMVFDDIDVDPIVRMRVSSTKLK